MDDQNESKESCKDACSVSNIMWWATLVLAVVAVPSFGVITAILLPLRGLGQLIIFILACWFCTYLGMYLMRNPKMSETINKQD